MKKIAWIRRWLIENSDKHINSETTASQYFTIGSIVVRLSDHNSFNYNWNIDVQTVANADIYFVKIKNSAEVFSFSDNAELKNFIKTYAMIFNSIAKNKEIKKEVKEIKAGKKPKNLKIESRPEIEVEAEENPLTKKEKILLKKESIVNSPDRYKAPTDCSFFGYLQQDLGKSYYEHLGKKGKQEVRKILKRCPEMTYKQLLGALKKTILSFGLKSKTILGPEHSDAIIKSFNEFNESKNQSPVIIKGLLPAPIPVVPIIETKSDSKKTFIVNHHSRTDQFRTEFISYLSADLPWITGHINKRYMIKKIKAGIPYHDILEILNKIHEDPRCISTCVIDEYFNEYNNQQL